MREEINREEITEWAESAEAVVAAINRWGRCYSGSTGLFTKFYSPACNARFDEASDIILAGAKEARRLLAEDARSKFDRQDARMAKVFASGDFPGMCYAMIGGRINYYANEEHALDALEAVFNAEAK